MKLSADQAKALKIMVEENSGALALYARSWCDCPEDAVQEALLELVKQPELPSEPLAWLFQAVRWRAIAMARSESRLKQRHERASQERDSWFEPRSEADGLHGQIVTEELEASLKQLGETDRAIVVAKIWGKQTFDQIAKAMQLSRTSAHRRYQQAILRLQELLSVSED